MRHFLITQVAIVVMLLFHPVESSEVAGRTHHLDQAGDQGSKPKAEKITITGCIRPAAVCHIFEVSDLKHKYTIDRSDQLKLNSRYRIVGVLMDAPNACGDYLQLVKTEKITPLKEPCAPERGGVPKR